MTLTGTSARFELIATGDLTSANVTGSAQIGTPSTAIAYDTAPDIAYSLAMSISAGDTLTLDLATGAITGEVAGVFQVETATVIAASGITGSGNATCVFTSPLVTGSPLSTSVSVTTALTTATLTAGAIRTALQAVTAITDHYTIGGTGAAITATALVKAADDATLNISTANGTCTGITTALTSATTTAGVGISKAYRISGAAWDQTDFEGKALDTATKLYSILVRRSASDTAGSAILYDAIPNTKMTLLPGGVEPSFAQNGAHIWSAESIDITAYLGDVTLTIDIQAGT